jgi:hypothetical protein
MKGIDGGELNGPGLTAGVIAWLVIMTIVGIEKGPGTIMGVGGDALLLGLIAIGMLAPAWIVASIVSVFFRKYMSDSDDPQKGDLILHGNLKLVPELKKRQLEVVIGNSEDVITEYIAECVKRVIEDKYDLKVRSFFCGEDLLEQAKNSAADIFIIVINNITFRSVYPPQEHLQYSIQLITQIKTIYHVPIIALSGLSDPSLVMRSKIAGADFFFPMPFKPDTFMEAIEKCLDMLPGVNGMV